MKHYISFLKGIWIIIVFIAFIAVIIEPDIPISKKILFCSLISIALLSQCYVWFFDKETSIEYRENTKWISNNPYMEIVIDLYSIKGKFKIKDELENIVLFSENGVLECYLDDNLEEDVILFKGKYKLKKNVCVIYLEEKMEEYLGEYDKIILNKTN